MISPRFLPAWIALSLLVGPAAHATWSIVAIDTDTRQVGVAGASCVSGAEVIAEMVPGVGAVVAQAFSNLAARSEMARLLAAGSSPLAVVERVANEEHDSFAGLPIFQLRQYGAVAFGYETQPASFTGRWTLGWSGARSGVGVSVQGNTLWGPEVAEAALLSYEGATDRCLADRLMSALEAGARAGGDRRCVRELSALSAFIVVAEERDPPEAPSLRMVRDLEPGGTGILRELWRNLVRRRHGSLDDNPVFQLRRAYEERRASSRVRGLCPAD